MVKTIIKQLLPNQRIFMFLLRILHLRFFSLHFFATVAIVAPIAIVKPSAHAPHATFPVALILIVFLTFDDVKCRPNFN